MKLLTASLTDKPLDWALAVATGREVAVSYDCDVIVPLASGIWIGFKGHTNPALCLGLIKSHIYKITHTHCGWEVFSDEDNRQFGESLEQAVARCVVQMHLGDEVDVPDELCEE